MRSVSTASPPPYSFSSRDPHSSIRRAQRVSNPLEYTWISMNTEDLDRSIAVFTHRDPSKSVGCRIAAVQSVVSITELFNTIVNSHQCISKKEAVTGR